MARLMLSLLGSFQVTLDGEPVTAFDSAKVRALLAYLAVEADRPHTRDALAGLLWPDWPDRSARTNLRNALANLRAAIGDREADPPYLLVSRQATAGGPTIQFNLDSDCWLDVRAFRALVEAERPDAGQLERAAALYRRPFLEGFSVGDSAAWEDWALQVREQFDRQALAAFEGLAAQCEAQGQVERACAWARRQVKLAPWEEEAHRRLMRLLALRGQRSAALAQYEACRRALREELDVEPSEETVTLYEHIRDGEDLAGFPKPARSPDGSPPRPPIPHNLPVQLTPFVGREALLTQIGERLGDPGCRLLTLVGPGGSGKTRLALEAAARQVERYPHGVFFVPLAPLRAVESIVPTVAQSLGFPFHGGGEPKQQLLDYLRRKRVLLVLDNFEHLVEGADITADILQAAPEVKVLATSRAALHVQGEHRFPVEGMTYPDQTSQTSDVWQTSEVLDRYSALKLFLAGARRVQPDFALTDQVLPDVVRICRLVEGIPLGILLAAAWVEILTPVEIADEIGRSLDVLQTDLQDVPDRQRSLRAAFDHSWNLLDEREREVFAALSVFAGGFTWEAAQEVAGASLRDLMSLVDRSLLHRTPGPSLTLRAEGRYDLHELLRQYAQEKLEQALGGGQSVRNRHGAYYLGLCGQWEADCRCERQQAALEAMDREISNVRTAWDWAAEQGHVEELHRAAWGLWFFYYFRLRYAEGEAAFRTAAGRLAAYGGDLAAPAFQRQTWAYLLACQSCFSLTLGHIESVQDLQCRSLALLDELERAGSDVRMEKAWTLWMVSDAEKKAGDARKTASACERSLALYRSLGMRWEVAFVLLSLGLCVQHQGFYDRTEQLYRESLAIHRELGDQIGVANSLAQLAWALNEQGNLDESEHLCRESLTYAQIARPSTLSSINEFIPLVAVLGLQGRFAEARPLADKALHLYREIRDCGALAFCTLQISNLETHEGQYAQARLDAQATLTLAHQAGDSWCAGAALLWLGCAAAAEGNYVEAQQRLQESLSIFEGMGNKAQAISARAVLGGVALLQGDPLGTGPRGRLDEAQEHLLAALRLLTQYRSFIAWLLALPFVALLLAEQGKGERATEIYALASRYPHVANSRFFHDMVGQRMSEVTASLPPDVVAAAQERGRARDPWATVEELLAEWEKVDR